MILRVGHSARRHPARYLRAAVTGLIGGVWAAYLVAQWSALRVHDGTLAPVPLLAAFGFAAGHWVLLGLGWWQAHQAIGGQLSPVAALRLWTNSMMWRYLPGNVWHVLGRVYLSGAAGQRRAAILASSLLEQILTLAGACLVILFCVPAWPAGGWLLIGAAAAGWAIGYLSLLTPSGLGVREGA